LKRDCLCGAKEVFAAFENLVAPVMAGLLTNRAESRTLAQLRDLLLPKLMSGEIRLKDAEKAIEQVA
jgi:type I restriction enzyme S subunit